MSNGGRTGGRNVPGNDGYGGIWSLQEIADAKRAGVWPQDIPKEISGLTLWFAADRLTGFNDGDAVTTWPDLSGNGYDVTQATAANKPLYKTGIFKGRPALLFDGSNDYFENTTVNPFISGAARTMFFFARILNTDTTVGFMSCRLSAPGVWFGNYLYGGNHLVFANMADDTQSIRSNSIAGGIYSRGTIVCVRSHATVAADAVRVDGAKSVSTIPGSYSAETGATGFRVGAREAAGAYMNGYIAEVIGYDSSLSDADCLKIERYLAIKYLDIAV